MSSSDDDSSSLSMPDNRCCVCLNLKIGAVLVACVNVLINLTFVIVFQTEVDDGQGFGIVEWTFFAIFPGQIAVDIALMFGAVNKKPNCLVPWLCLNALIMCVLLVLIALLFIFGYHRLGYDYTEYVSALSVLGVVAAVHLFCCLVVFQFRKNMLDEMDILRQRRAAHCNAANLEDGGDEEPEGVPRRRPASPPPAYDDLVKEKKLSPPEYDDALILKPSAPPSEKEPHKKS